MIRKRILFWLLLLALGCASESYLLNREGVELAEQRKYEEAAGKFQAAVEKDPENTAASLNLGRTLLLLEKNEEAIGVLRGAAEKNPESLEARLLLVQAHILRKDMDEARRMLEEMQSRDPKNAYFQIVLGDLALVSEDWEGAVAHYLRGVELDPSCDRCYLQMGRAQMRREMSRLEKEKAPAVEEIADPRIAMTRMANVMAWGGLNLDEATASFRKAVYLNPENAEARIILGSLAFQRTDYKQAELEWGEALRLNPEDLHLHVALGVNAQRQQKYEDAAWHFEKAEGIAPEEPRPILLQILLNLERREGEKAVRQAMAAADKFPGLERELFVALGQDPSWLVGLVSHKEESVSSFCVRALAAISGLPPDRDPERWRAWWREEEARMREREKSMPRPPEDFGS